ncbi:MAG TPA: hypothetical protein V6D06_20345, partial [Trichocoleus sp.]
VSRLTTSPKDLPRANSKAASGSLQVLTFIVQSECDEKMTMLFFSPFFLIRTGFLAHNLLLYFPVA